MQQSAFRLGRRLGVVCSIFGGCHLAAHNYVSVERSAALQFAATKQALIDDAARSLGYERPKPKATPAPKLSRRERVTAVAKRRRINPDLAWALLYVESTDQAYAISRVGAIGLMQVMPENAKPCGLKHHSELWDEDKNIECGMQLFAEALERYKGDVTLALYDYNAGPNGVRAIKRCGVNNLECLGGYYETVDHAKKVLKTLARNIG